MIKILANSTYINARNEWREGIRSYFDDAKLRQDFESWLENQGAEVEFSSLDVVSTDMFGISVGNDYLVFDNDHLATIFLIKWA